MKTIIEIFFKSYRRFISPVFHNGLLWPGGCRFYPTCSAYGLQAVRQYGLTTGFVFLFRRLLRCHPWGGSGYDPIPKQSL